VKWAHAVAQLVEALRCKLEGHGFEKKKFPMVSLEFFTSGCIMALGVDSASNRNVYQNL